MAIFKRTDTSEPGPGIFRRTAEPEVNYQQEPEQTKGLEGIMRDIASIPGAAINYGLSLPTKASESYHQAMENPWRAAGNVGFGLGEGAKSLVNAPHSLAQYLKSKDVPWFKQTADYVPHIPEDLGIERAVMGEEQPGDELLKLIPQLIAGNKLAAPLKAEIPLKQAWAAKHLEKSRKLANEGGAKINLSPDLIEEARTFFPNNKPTQNLFNSLSEGYDPNFTLQSDLGAIARELSRSSSGADRLLAKQITGPRGKPELGLRGRILGEMRQQLSEQDLKKAADYMKRGQNKYRQYMKYVHPISSRGPELLSNSLGVGALYKLLKHIL